MSYSRGRRDGRADAAAGRGIRPDVRADPAPRTDYACGYLEGYGCAERERDLAGEVRAPSGSDAPVGRFEYVRALGEWTLTHGADAHQGGPCHPSSATDHLRARGYAATDWQVTPERITARVSYPVRGAP